MVFIEHFPAKERKMSEKTQRVEVCTCDKCANEAEMTVTCELMPVEDPKKRDPGVEKTGKEVLHLHPLR